MVQRRFQVALMLPHRISFLQRCTGAFRKFVDRPWPRIRHSTYLVIDSTISIWTSLAFSCTCLSALLCCLNTFWHCLIYAEKASTRSNVASTNFEAAWTRFNVTRIATALANTPQTLPRRFSRVPRQTFEQHHNVALARFGVARSSPTFLDTLKRRRVTSQCRFNVPRRHLADTLKPWHLSETASACSDVSLCCVPSSLIDRHTVLAERPQTRVVKQRSSREINVCSTIFGER